MPIDQTPEGAPAGLEPAPTPADSWTDARISAAPPSAPPLSGPPLSGPPLSGQPLSGHPDWTPPEIRPGQLEFTRDELLTSHPVEEPLMAGDVLCHGGFIGGRYYSPRTLVRIPAIHAWKGRLAAEGHPLVYFPREYLPPQYPNYEQAKLLLLSGVSEPVVRTLTTIAIVEGFGARIREVGPLRLESDVVEDLGGTCLAHLEGGLFEAHARDEAGWRREGGHKQMWEAARDLGLDHPDVPGDVLMQLMMNMGGGGRRAATRNVPEISKPLESLITLMANVMVIEIFAAEMFAWGRRLLGDPEISARPAEAGGMVACIEADESPHVEYLRTALSELRARDLRTEDGKGRIRGSEVVDRILTAQLRGIASDRPRQQREQSQDEIHRMLMARPNGEALRRRFEDLDSGWRFPENQEIEIQLRVYGNA